MTPDTIEPAITRFTNADNPMIALLSIMLFVVSVALAWYVRGDRSRDKIMQELAVTLAVLTEVVRNHGK